MRPTEISVVTHAALGYMPRQLMKRLILPSTLATFLALLTACEPTQRQQPKNPGGFHQKPTVTQNPQTGEEEDERPSKTEKPEKPKTEKPKPDEPKVESPVVEAPRQVGEVPYGKAVPGKPGFVTSPHGGSGYIDARGFPPGTEVKDPYSGKTFLVP